MFHHEETEKRRERDVCTLRKIVKLISLLDENLANYGMGVDKNEVTKKRCPFALY